MCLMYAQRNGIKLAIANPKLIQLSPAITIPTKENKVKLNPIVMQFSLLKCLIYSS